MAPGRWGSARYCEESIASGNGGPRFQGFAAQRRRRLGLFQVPLQAFGITRQFLTTVVFSQYLAEPRERIGVLVLRSDSWLHEAARQTGGVLQRQGQRVPGQREAAQERRRVHTVWAGHGLSPDLISRVTDAVVNELRAWQQRPLDRTYLIVYLDALVLKIRDKGAVQNKHVYLAVGVGIDGKKDVLGMWVQATEGAKFWLSIMNELKSRGVHDILVLCADGLTGLAEAVEAAYPQAIFQTCIVHVVRNSTRFVPWKDRKLLCADLRTVYTAADEEAALEALDAFEAKWGERFPMIGEMWRRRWTEISPFLAFPPEVRRAIYTTNAIESLSRILRKVLKTKGHLPNDDAACKLLYLAIRKAKKTWGAKPHYTWNQALLPYELDDSRLLWVQAQTVLLESLRPSCKHVRLS